jgi:hypothetical protein
MDGDGYDVKIEVPNSYFVPTVITRLLSPQTLGAGNGETYKLIGYNHVRNYKRFGEIKVE